MESLFGVELSLPVKFFIAFAVVLALIGAAAYFVRRFSAGALRSGAQRGRQPRLAVVDAAAIDNRRRLLIVRRDNVEHLLLVGGPTDVLIEPNIVRSAPVQSGRDSTQARTSNIDAPAIPALDNSSRLLQPEAVARPKRPATEEPTAWQTPAQPQPPVRATAPAEIVPEPAPAMVVPPMPPPAAPPVAQAEPAARVVLADEIHQQVAYYRQEPAMAPPAPQPELRAPAQGPAPLTASEDQNLADMAHRLEAALRRPLAPDVTVVAAGRPVPMPEPALRAQRAPEVMPPQPPGNGGKPAAVPPEPHADPRNERPVYEGLEREMANLLGRASGSS